MSVALARGLVWQWKRERGVRLLLQLGWPDGMWLLGLAACARAEARSGSGPRLGCQLLLGQNEKERKRGKQRPFFFLKRISNHFPKDFQTKI